MLAHVCDNRNVVVLAAVDDVKQRGRAKRAAVGFKSAARKTRLLRSQFCNLFPPRGVGLRRHRPENLLQRFGDIADQTEVHADVLIDFG